MLRIGRNSDGSPTARCVKHLLECGDDSSYRSLHYAGETASRHVTVFCTASYPLARSSGSQSLSTSDQSLDLGNLEALSFPFCRGAQELLINRGSELPAFAVLAGMPSAVLTRRGALPAG